MADLRHYEGRKSTCFELAKNLQVAHFHRTTETGIETKTVFFGCGKQYLCNHCATIRTNERVSYYQAIFDAFFSRNPYLVLLQWTFTVPPEYLRVNGESRASYQKFLSAVNTAVKIYLPDSPVLLCLHNWKSTDPCRPHLHCHVLAINCDRKANRLPYFVDPSPLQKSIRHSLKLSCDPVVNLEYAHSNEYFKIKHYLKYCLRSPIEDYTSIYGDILREPYLYRVSFLHGFHRFRPSGCLGCRVINDTLNGLQLEIFKKDISEGWELDFIDFISVYDFLNGGESHFGLKYSPQSTHRSRGTPGAKFVRHKQDKI